MDRPLMPVLRSAFAVTAAALLFIGAAVILMQGLGHRHDDPGPWSMTPFGLFTIALVAGSAFVALAYFGPRLLAVDYPRRAFGVLPNPPPATYRDAARFLRAVRRDDRASIVGHLSRVRGANEQGSAKEELRSPSTALAKGGAYALLVVIAAALIAGTFAPGLMFSMGGLPLGLLFAAALAFCYLLFRPYMAWLAWYARANVATPSRPGGRDAR